MQSNMTITTTDTPRTDAAFGDNLVKCYCPRCIVGVHDDIQLAAQYRAHAEWRERAEEAEFEVKRLRSQLARAVEIAEGFCGCGCGGDYGLCNSCSDYFSELDQIKATLNPTEK